MTRPIRVAVIGVGYVGTLHAQIYRRLPGAKLIAVCDTNHHRANEIARTLKCQAVTNLTTLVGQIDAASVSVPTSLHHRIGSQLLRHGIHVLMEKPLTISLKEADELLALAARNHLILQVGHIERFNAAIQEAQQYLTHPRFIETHRLSPYPFRGTDVSVVLDVMIHDLDLILSLVHAQPRCIDAIGVAVLSRSEDIANARLVFPSGCVANLTASRVSDESIRRIRLFQEDCYLSIDYKHQTVELARKRGATIRRQVLDVKQRPALDEELAAFVRAVSTRQRPIVSGEEAREALALALKIEQVMRRQKQSVVHGR